MFLNHSKTLKENCRHYFSQLESYNNWVRNTLDYKTADEIINLTISEQYNLHCYCVSDGF